MIHHIVVERSLGFGGGGWEIGYHIYLIAKGKKYKTIRTMDNQVQKVTVKRKAHWVTCHCGKKYDINQPRGFAGGFCCVATIMLAKAKRGDLR